jgi:hypothetical protein
MEITTALNIKTYNNAFGVTEFISELRLSGESSEKQTKQV